MTNIKLIISISTLLVLVLFNISHALTFSVSNINFSDVVGNSSDVFNWRVVARNDLTRSLEVGDRWSFTYGYFRVNDFPISFAEENDTDDSFTSNFSVFPSGYLLGDSFAITGTPTAVQTSSTNNDPDGDYAYVQFPASAWQQIAFGDGGIYSLRFLNPINVDSSIARDPNLYDAYNVTGEQLRLRASIRYDVAPVPEPATFVLLGVGLVALVFYRKRKS